MARLACAIFRRTRVVARVVPAQAAEAEDAGELVDGGDVGLGDGLAVLVPGQGQRGVPSCHHTLDGLPVTGPQTGGEGEGGHLRANCGTNSASASWPNYSK